MLSIKAAAMRTIAMRRGLTHVRDLCAGGPKIDDEVGEAWRACCRGCLSRLGPRPTSGDDRRQPHSFDSLDD